MNKKPQIKREFVFPEGSVPPQAIELEKDILGAIMMERGAFDTASEILKPECFYVETHMKIFTVFQEMAYKSMTIDLNTVAVLLNNKGELEAVGGVYALTELTRSVVSSARIEQHARIVLEKYMQRELIKAGAEIMNDGFDSNKDIFDQIDEAEGKIFKITSGSLKNEVQTAPQALAKTMTQIDLRRSQTDDITGVPSGLPDLDRVTHGWQPADLIIIAARPAVGKTALALNLARNAALHPIKPTPAAIFSLEMATIQLIERILSAESEVPLDLIKTGKLSDQEYHQLQVRGVKRIESAPIYIDDTAALNIFEFRAKARRLVNKYKVGIIIIDYLQLMSGTGEKGQNREQEISTISRNLKVLAKELNVPIIALSQLSRAVETRGGNKIPQLSDLRESGAIEQDADMVMFIYRPEYYEQMNNELGESTKGETHIRIAKHRNGSLETIKILAQLHIQKFKDWTESSMPVENGKWVRAPIDYTQAKNKNFDEGFNEQEPF